MGFRPSELLPFIYNYWKNRLFSKPIRNMKACRAAETRETRESDDSNDSTDLTLGTEATS